MKEGETETAIRLPGWGAGLDQVLGRGAVLGRYFILDRLGSGGMGIVYAAYDPELDRKVAVKLLRPGRTGGAEAGVRLLREAQAMARLSHPNVLAVHDVGTFGDQVFVAMELVDGADLRQWLAASPRSEREILDVFVKAGRGLAAAHAAGLVHLDFKPANVLVGRDGRVRVADFGLAQAEGGSGAAGTPAYMAPEQLAGQPVDARTDQLSFCGSLYEALYGARPFVSGSFEVVDPPSGSKVPIRLRRLLLRGLAVNPDDRFVSMADLLTALESDPRPARRRWAMALAVAVVVGSALLGLGWIWRERAQICGGAESKLVGVWDEGARERVRKAFLATRAPYARDAFLGVERTLDAYTGAWVSMHREACEATRLRGEQSEEMLDLRMGCLRRRLEEVRGLTGVFLQADAQVVQKSVEAAGALSSLKDCENVEVLAAPVRPPASPEARSRIDRMQTLLGRAKALNDSGKYSEALKVMKIAAAESGKLEYPPLAAEVFYTLGNLYGDLGDFKAALQTHQRAIVLAQAGRDARTTARAASSLQNLSAIEFADPDQAKWWDDLSEAASRSSGGDDVLRAGLLFNQGIVLRVQGSYREAEERLKASLALWEKVYGPDHVFVAATLNSLTNVLADQGKYQEAEESGQRALGLFRRLLGPAHPNVAKVLTNLGTVARNRQDYPLALERLREALAINERVLGPDHPEVNLVVYNMANVLQDQERHQEAKAYYERVLAFDERQFGPGHPNVAEDLSGIANCLADMGKLEEAESYLQRALAIQVKAQGPDHPAVSFMRVNLAGVYLRQKDYAQALEHYRKALSIAEKSLGPGHRYVGEDLKGVGRSLVELGRPGEALPLLERSLKILEPQSKDPIEIAAVRFFLARALWETGARGDRALALAQQARAACREIRSRDELCPIVNDWFATVRPLGGA